MTEPFGDAERFRASYGIYELATGARPLSEPPRLSEPSPVTTLILYGPEDPVVPPAFVRRCEVAFPDRIGPFVVPGAGHFVPWERAELFNGALSAFSRDLLRAGGARART